MAAPQLDSGRVDRSAFTVTTFEAAEREDREYWRPRSPEERLAARELSRPIAYGLSSKPDLELWQARTHPARDRGMNASRKISGQLALHYCDGFCRRFRNFFQYFSGQRFGKPGPLRCLQEVSAFS